MLPAIVTVVCNLPGACKTLLRRHDDRRNSGIWLAAPSWSLRFCLDSQVRVYGNPIGMSIKHKNNPILTLPELFNILEETFERICRIKNRKIRDMLTVGGCTKPDDIGKTDLLEKAEKSGAAI